MPEGQYIDIGDLDVSEVAQTVWLPCSCTVTYFARIEGDLYRSGAHVRFTNVPLSCALDHSKGRVACIGFATRVWVDPDAPQRKPMFEA